MSGLRNRDPFLADIIDSAKMGWYDRHEREGPSTLLQTPTLELLPRLRMMSPERRRLYLAEIGRIRGEKRLLSGGRRSTRTRRVLSAP